MNSHNHKRAFSLVEVALALGIGSFCLVVLVALIPVGLSAIRQSREQAAAAIAIEQLTNAIRNATVTANTSGSKSYQAAGAYSDLVWSVPTAIGITVQNTYTNLTLSGLPSTVINDHRLAARVQISPPSSPMAGGTALVSVAWPATAVWNKDSSSWTNADGSTSTWLMFATGQ